MLCRIMFFCLGICLSWNVSLAYGFTVSSLGHGVKNSGNERPFGGKIRPLLSSSSRVLFIGNSFTYVHSMPYMLERMARGSGYNLTVSMIAEGAATLESLYKSPEVRGKYEQNGGKWVVLQEQSELPVVHPEIMMRYGEKWGELIKKRGARPIYYLTWARLQQENNLSSGLDEVMQAELTLAYCRLAQKTNGVVVPVGVAWSRSMRQYPSLILLESDGKHPTRAGAYLTACVFYGVFYGKSPVGLPSRLENHRRVLCELKKEDALKLQKVAWQTVCTFQPKQVLAQEVYKQAQLVDEKDVKSILGETLTLKKLMQILGKPEMSNVGEHTYQFVLKDKVTLIVVFSQEGMLKMATFSYQDGRPTVFLSW